MRHGLPKFAFCVLFYVSDTICLFNQILYQIGDAKLLPETEIYGYLPLSLGGVHFSIDFTVWINKARENIETESSYKVTSLATSRISKELFN